MKAMLRKVVLLICVALAPFAVAAEKSIVALEMPRELGNQELAALGLVDVTAAPFKADPSGRADSTRALQAAIEFARDHQMVCFFPPGTYTVSDTLECIQGRFDRATGKVSNSRLAPCVLMGSRRAPQRPRIVLAPRSPGFGDPAHRKYLVHFWSRGNGKEGIGPEAEQSNISMNQRLVNIDVVIGEGNPGAVAVRHRGAQGSGVQDCLIDARHGYTGLADRLRRRLFCGLGIAPGSPGEALNAAPTLVERRAREAHLNLLAFQPALM